jgi:hypothetical protein
MGNIFKGAVSVSAACVEETTEGIIIRLASNEAPVNDTVSKLRSLLKVLSDGTKHGKYHD